MGDCTQALKATNGDINAAMEWLKKKGLMTFEKKRGRTTAYGTLIAAVVPDRIGLVVRLSCETDFAARNNTFLRTAVKVRTEAQKMISAAVPENVLLVPPQEWSQKLSAACLADIAQCVSVIGENVAVTDVQTVRLPVTSTPPPATVFGHYVHNEQDGFDGLGWIIGLVALRSRGGGAVPTLSPTLPNDIAQLLVSSCGETAGLTTQALVGSDEPLSTVLDRCGLDLVGTAYYDINHPPNNEPVTTA